jgi:hypothetical protein
LEGKGSRLKGLGLRRGLLDRGRRVPEPTPISISTDSLVNHRPAQLGMTMFTFHSCTGPYVRTDCLWVKIGAGQTFQAEAMVPEGTDFNFY